MNAAFSDHKICSKEPRSHLYSHERHSIWNNDDNHKVWTLEPISSCMDTGLHPGSLNGKCDVLTPNSRVIPHVLQHGFCPTIFRTISLSADIQQVRTQPLCNGGVGRTLSVSLILSSIWQNALPSGQQHAGYISHKPWLQCRPSYHMAPRIKFISIFMQRKVRFTYPSLPVLQTQDNCIE